MSLERAIFPPIFLKCDDLQDFCLLYFFNMKKLTSTSKDLEWENCGYLTYVWGFFLIILAPLDWLHLILFHLHPAFLSNREPKCLNHSTMGKEAQSRSWSGARN